MKNQNALKHGKGDSAAYSVWSGMREIKFRAWDKRDNHMFHSVQINGNGTVRYYPDGNPDKYICGEKSKRFELMQFTGLKDKNGVEIYEGDIVRAFDIVKDDSSGLRKVVKFKHGSFIDSYFGFCLHDYQFVEVIGNIYESKHLLGNTDTKA